VGWGYLEKYLSDRGMGAGEVALNPRLVSFWEIKRDIEKLPKMSPTQM
jgi:hypothetical protein